MREILELARPFPASPSTTILSTIGVIGTIPPARTNSTTTASSREAMSGGIGHRRGLLQQRCRPKLRRRSLERDVYPGLGRGCHRAATTYWWRTRTTIRPTDSSTSIPTRTSPALIRLYNNTFVGQGTGIAGITFGPHVVLGACDTVAQTINVKINLFSRTWPRPSPCTSSTASVTVHVNYNLGYNLKPGQQYSSSTTSSAVFRTLEQWQAQGNDLHGTTGNANLNADGTFPAARAQPSARAPICRHWTV